MSSLNESRPARLGRWGIPGRLPSAPDAKITLQVVVFAKEGDVSTSVVSGTPSVSRRRRYIGAEVEPSLYESLSERAALADRSVASMIRLALLAYLREEA